jgi:hypothetical protein
LQGDDMADLKVEPMVEVLLEKKAFVDWLKELEWKPSDIKGVSVSNEIVPNGHVKVDGKRWANWKQGNCVDIAIMTDQEGSCQRFARLGNGELQKVEAWRYGK